MINISNPKFGPSIHVIKKLLKYLIYGGEVLLRMQKVEEEDNGWENKFYLILFIDDD